MGSEAHSIQAAGWQRIGSERAVVFFQPEDRAGAGRVLEQIMEGLPRIEADLGVSGVDTVTVFIASSDQVFRELTGGQIPDWGSAAADPERLTLFLKSSRIARDDDGPEVVLHELTHAVMGMALREGAAPRWFEEGVAMFESGDPGAWDSFRLGRALAGGQMLWLAEIEDVLGFRRDRAFLAYQESREAVVFLVRVRGRNVLADLVRAMNGGATMDQALRAVAGVGLDEFEQGWAADLKRKYKWVVLFDYTLWTAAVMSGLFLLAYTVKRIQTAKKKAQWEAEARATKTYEEN